MNFREVKDIKTLSYPKRLLDLRGMFARFLRSLLRKKPLYLPNYTTTKLLNYNDLTRKYRVVELRAFFNSLHICISKEYDEKINLHTFDDEFEYFVQLRITNSKDWKGTGETFILFGENILRCHEGI